jgi:hypothetical protein
MLTVGITSAKGFRHPDFKVCWRSLSSFDGGQSIRRNFRRDDNIPTPIAEQFTSRVARLVGEGRGGTPIETMGLAIMENPQLTLSGPMSSLATGDVLVRWELDYYLNKRLARISGGSSRDLGALRKDLRAGIFTVLDKVKLENQWGIVWCTLGTAIDKWLSKGDTLERIRDRMGLRHFAWGEVIEFRYEVSSVSTLRRPTTLDAFDSPDFRPSRLGDRTGYTKDIKTRRRGLPELVHEGCLCSSVRATVSVRGKI